jgi:hypothetical protein
MRATQLHILQQIVVAAGRNQSVSVKLALHLYRHQFEALMEKLSRQSLSLAQLNDLDVSLAASMPQQLLRQLSDSLNI